MARDSNKCIRRESRSVTIFSLLTALLLCISTLKCVSANEETKGHSLLFGYISGEYMLRETYSRLLLFGVAAISSPG
jgi:hypothetical protein